MTQDSTKRGDGGRDGVSRRDVLRTAAAATATGLGVGAFAGTGAARATTIDHVGGVDAADVRASHRRDGSDVLDALAADGLLATGSVSELRTDEPVDVGDVAANREGTAAVRGSDGVLRYVTVTHVDGGVLTFTAEPEVGRAYARFRPAGGGARHLYDPARDLDGVPRDVGAQADCTCRGETCGNGRPLEECTECYMGSECPPPDYLCCDTWYDCC